MYKTQAAQDRAWSPYGTQRPPSRPGTSAGIRLSPRRRALWMRSILQARSWAACASCFI